MRRGLASLSGLTLLGAGAACAAVLGVDDVAYVPPTDASVGDAGVGGVREDAGSAADGRTGDGGCGLDGVRVPELKTGNAHATFCIDALEVSAKSYYAFLAAMAGNVGDTPPRCEWNTTHKPGDINTNCETPTRPDLPMACIDWCDAWAYCTWAGKRLCGGIDGGAAPPLPDNTALSRWFLACSRNDDGLHTYPYGNFLDVMKCNGITRSEMIPSGSLASCQGGFDGLFDMSGNIDEFEDACDLRDGAGDLDVCRIRGGSRNDSDLLACKGLELPQRNFQDPNVGFRCCWDP